MNERIIMRTGEALVAGGPPGTAAEPEVIIGELDGPVGTAIASMTAGQVQGHTRVFAILNTDIQVRPVTLMVSKVTVKNTRYTYINGHGTGRNCQRSTGCGTRRRHS